MRRRVYDEYDYGYEPYTREEIRLESELKRLLRPEGLDAKEDEAREGRGYGFTEVVCRNVETPQFLGTVAVEYSNNDWEVNPGYERGTQTKLMLAGRMAGKLLAYVEGSVTDIGFTGRRHRVHDLSQPMLAEAMREAVDYLRQEKEPEPDQSQPDRSNVTLWSDPADLWAAQNT